MPNFLQRVFRRREANRPGEPDSMSTASSSSSTRSMEAQQQKKQGSSRIEDRNNLIRATSEQQQEHPIAAGGKRKRDDDMQCDNNLSTNSSKKGSSGNSNDSRRRSSHFSKSGGATSPRRAAEPNQPKKDNNNDTRLHVPLNRPRKDSPRRQQPEVIVLLDDSSDDDVDQEREKQRAPTKAAATEKATFPLPKSKQHAETKAATDTKVPAKNNNNNQSSPAASGTRSNLLDGARSNQQDVLVMNNKNNAKDVVDSKLPATVHSAKLLRPNSDNDEPDEENDGKDNAISTGLSPKNIEDPPEHEIRPTCSELERMCWACHVELPRLSSGNNNHKDSSAEQTFICYTKHSHTLLKTPICCVCQEKVQLVMEDHAQDRTTTEDCCAGCAAEEEADVLLLCDNNVEECNRAFCEFCVAQAYGGGIQGWRRVQQEIKSEKCWNCPVCAPPVALQSLQEASQEPECKKKRAEEEILDDLAVVEAKKKECLEALDSDDGKCDEIRDELIAGGLCGDELEENLKIGMDLWTSLQEDHLYRLEDSIGLLQDELALAHNVSPPLISYSKAIGNDDVDSKDDETPDWVAAADAENKMLEKEGKRMRYKSPLPPSAFVDDQYDSVDELDDSDVETDDDEVDRLGWRNSESRATKIEIQRALEEENRQIAERRQLTRFKYTKDSHDAEVALEEDKASKLVGYKGAARSLEEKLRPLKRSRMPVIEENRARFRSPQRNSRSCSSNVQTESPLLRGSPGNRSRSIVSKPAYSSQDTDAPSSPARKRARSEDHRTIFRGSGLVLCSRKQASEETGIKACRTVSVATELSKKLKPHQVDGVHFIWRNCFVDFIENKNGKPDHPAVGGCLLAHNMGLGKTFTIISLLHAVLTHPSMLGNLRTVLLVVPVNTIANWVKEFDEWTDHLMPTITVCNLSTFEKNSRRREILKWKQRGGVLLLGDQTYLRLCKKTEKIDEKTRDVLQTPDVLVLDEAHTMVKSTGDTSKALARVKTKRRILLTGTPFQNNLLEYYRMCQFVRPGLFGTNMTELKFEKEYVSPIMGGLASDSTVMAQDLSVAKSDELSKRLEPYMHRIGVAVLAKELPPLSQAVLHVRQSRLQSNLYRRFSRLQQIHDDLKNFFRAYTELRPITNHPFCLLVPSKTQQPKQAANPYSERSDTSSWWKKSLESAGVTPDGDLAIESGYKIVLLLHILAYAELLGEKVLVFSQCLKTLDYIERVLGLEDWKTHVPSLGHFSDLKLGGWKKSRDYLRIDGDTKSAQRGELVDTFNQGDIDEESARLFLISSLAGGIGINLTAASRVVMLDSHFNPTVNEQALFRAYRYGQSRPVFCYRMLTESSMENKIYSRSVNKQGLALRVIDKKYINRNFTAKEVEDLCSTLNWVQCDKCQKWRVLLDESTEEVEHMTWTCEMNSDTRNNNCSIPERTQFWYETNCEASDTVPKVKNHLKSDSSSDADDPILAHLLTVSESGKDTALISQHYFHDTLLKAEDAQDQVKNARKRLADGNKEPCDAPDELAPSEDGSVAQKIGAKNDKRTPPRTPSPAKRSLAFGGSSPSPKDKTEEKLPVAVSSESRAKKRSPRESPGLQRSRKRILSEEGKGSRVATDAVTSDDGFNSSDDDSGTQLTRAKSPAKNRQLSFDDCTTNKNSLKQPKVEVHSSQKNDATVSAPKRAPSEPEVIDLCWSSSEE